MFVLTFSMKEKFVYEVSFFNTHFQTFFFYKFNLIILLQAIFLSKFKEKIILCNNKLMELNFFLFKGHFDNIC